VADRLELAFRRAADRLVPADVPVVVAVSGGSDSMALLHLILRYRRGRTAGVVVAHLDHGLRRGSRADRTFVEAVARALGLAAVSDRRDVETRRRRSESTEEAARRVRREFLHEVARDVQASTIALGHTRDDQAETILLRLLRGAGPTALAAMRERGPGPFVRPLLDLERIDLRRFLERHDLAWREDPSNRDERFDRNRIRHRVMPVLADLGFPRAGRALVRAADRLREDAEHLDVLAGQRLARIRSGADGERFTLDAPALARLAAPLGRRVVRLALRQAGVSEKAASVRLIDAVLDLAGGPRGRRLDLPGRRTVRRVGDRLEWRPPAPR
jgi:tRNA(Ile)-lysidine synthase